jgi:hypothetical protein
MQNTLLSDASSCVSAECFLGTESSPDGSLSIEILESSKMNIEHSDLLEISGTCADMGRVDNRIFVRVYNNSEVLSVEPYIDNSKSTLCLSDDAASGLTGQQCLFITQGPSFKLATDSGETEFPRCINGRFSFMVRLGDITLISPSSVKNYSVQVQLQVGGTSTENSTSNELELAQTEFVEQIVTRSVTSPEFAVKTVGASNTCEIYTEPYKFNPTLLYYIYRQKVGFTNMGVTNLSTIDPIVGPLTFNYTPLNTASALARIAENGLVPGVTYRYSTSTQDPTSNVQSDNTTNVISCVIPAPVITGTVNETSNVCNVSVATAVGPLFEWAYSTTPGWTSSNGAGTPILGGNNGGVEHSPGTANTVHYIAVRYRDASGIYGEWSNELSCVYQN